jgi:hypothetical protein
MSQADTALLHERCRAIDARLFPHTFQPERFGFPLRGPADLWPLRDFVDAVYYAHMVDAPPPAVDVDFSPEAIAQDPMKLLRARRDLRHGRVRSKYRILGFISQGTYGHVYVAQTIHDPDALRAIKRLKTGDRHNHIGISQSAITEIRVIFCYCKENTDGTLTAPNSSPNSYRTTTSSLCEMLSSRTKLYTSSLTTPTTTFTLVHMTAAVSHTELSPATRQGLQIPAHPDPDRCRQVADLPALKRTFIPACSTCCSS